MAVVDSSALIPLARSGKLDLIRKVFDRRITVEEVRSETVKEGKKGSSKLEEAFESWLEISEVEADYSETAELEGISRTDALVIALAEEKNQPLLANDKALVATARSRNVDVVWPTTLILKAVKDGEISPEEAEETVSSLVSEGMNLSPQVYDRIMRELRDLELSGGEKFLLCFSPEFVHYSLAN